jgi:hypothetical protein
LGWPEIKITTKRGSHTPPGRARQARHNENGENLYRRSELGQNLRQPRMGTTKRSEREAGDIAMVQDRRVGYLQRAAECEEKAGSAFGPVAKDMWLHAAAAWKELAVLRALMAEMERVSPGRPEIRSEEIGGRQQSEESLSDRSSR